MAYIFIVKYSVLFGLFNFGLGFGLLNLASASTSASSVWPRPQPWPQAFGLVQHLWLQLCATPRPLPTASSPSLIVCLYLAYLKLLQEVISRLDSRTLRSVKVVFSNNIKNDISDIRYIKCQIMAWP